VGWGYLAQENGRAFCKRELAILGHPTPRGVEIIKQPILFCKRARKFLPHKITWEFPEPLGFFCKWAPHQRWVRDVPQAYVWHDIFICVAWHIPICDIPHSCVWLDLCICATWLRWHLHMCDLTHSYVWPDSGKVSQRREEVRDCVTRLMHMCDLTYAHVWHDSCTCVTWLMHMCDITHPYVWRASCMCVTWLRYLWHDSWLMTHDAYGVAMISRLIKFTGLFCKRAL